MSKTAVLVMGAPRSGTSAVSHLMSELGVYFGEKHEFVDPLIHSHNPIFFELKCLNDLNDRVMKEMGHDYGQFDYFPRLEEPLINEHPYFNELAQELVEKQLAAKELIGLKDPRFVFTLPLWELALQGMGYEVKLIATQRSVDDVVRSNQDVNKGSENYNRRVAMLSIGLTALRVKDRDHLIINYDELVNKPEKQAHEIINWLGLDQNKESVASGVIQAELRHHDSNGDDLDKNKESNINNQAKQYTEFMRMMDDFGIFDLLDVRRKWFAAVESGNMTQETSSMMQDGVGRLLGKVDSNSEALGTLKEWIKSQNEDLSNMLKSRDEIAKKFEESLRERIQSLEHELQQRPKLTQQLVDSLRAQIQSLETDFRKREEMATELRIELSSQITDLKDRNKKLIAENSEIKNISAEKESILNQRVKEIEGIALERARAFSRSTSALNIAHGDIHRLEKYIEQLENEHFNEITALKDEITNAQNKILEYQSSVDALRLQSENLKAEYAALMPLYKKIAWYYRAYGLRALVKRVLKRNANKEFSKISGKNDYSTEEFITNESEKENESTSDSAPLSQVSLEVPVDDGEAVMPYMGSARRILEERYSAIQPLPVVYSDTSEVRVNMVTDSINKGSLFGGVGTAIILSTLLAKNLGARLRIVTRTESPDRSGLYDVLECNEIDYKDEIEFEHVGVNDKKACLPIGDGDRFLTTSWWTTACVLGSIPPSKVDYLLQEDERMFYPHGDDQLRCREILGRSDIRFIINTELLYKHLIHNGLAHLEENGKWFEPAFPQTMFYMSHERNDKLKKRLFFYARPNNLRNIFYRGIEVLDTAVSSGIINPDDWEIFMVGKDVPALTLGGILEPTILSTMDWNDYGKFIRSVDLGFILMDTPHPSYPPLDLAASGAIVLTNKHGKKDDLHKYSENIVCKELTVEMLIEGLQECLTRVDNNEARVIAYEKNGIARSWNKTMSSVINFIGKS